MKYPGAVFVITDGFGNEVRPKHPERWHWFLTERNMKTFIPEKSAVHSLKDFD